MTFLFKKLALGLSAFAVVATSGAYGIANAAGAKSDYKMEHVHWHFDGPRVMTVRPFSAASKSTAKFAPPVIRLIICHFVI